MASKSCTGKTTALKVAASVWGNENIIIKWNALLKIVLKEKLVY